MIDQYINRIIQGDCLEVMKGMSDKCVDLIVTDPPYGIKMSKGYKGFEGFRGFGKPIKRKSYQDNWDYKRPCPEIFYNILRVGKSVIIFGGNYFADILPQSTHWIVWDKLQTMPTFSDCELLWTNINRKSVKKITVEWNGLLGKENIRLHPTQKPVKLIEKIIDTYSKQGDIIFDPFSGSGTTAVAAKELNRKFICVEIDPKYCKIAEDRLKQEVLGI